MLDLEMPMRKQRNQQRSRPGQDLTSVVPAEQDVLSLL